MHKGEVSFHRWCIEGTRGAHALLRLATAEATSSFCRRFLVAPLPTHHQSHHQFLEAVPTCCSPSPTTADTASGGCRWSLLAAHCCQYHWQWLWAVPAHIHHNGALPPATGGTSRSCLFPPGTIFSELWPAWLQHEDWPTTCQAS